VRRFLHFLPSSNREPAPRRDTTDDAARQIPALDTLIPDNPNLPYDIRELVTRVCDEEDFFELQEDFAANIVIGFGRMNGDTVGFVANQPMVLAGCLDINASRKARNTAASSNTEQNFCLLTVKLRYPRLPSSRARLMEALTMSCHPNICAAISTMPIRLQRLP